VNAINKTKKRFHVHVYQSPRFLHALEIEANTKEEAVAKAFDHAKANPHERKLPDIDAVVFVFTNNAKRNIIHNDLTKYTILEEI